MSRTKKTEVAQPSFYSRCRIINAAIREGCIVQANIQGTMQTIISIKSDDQGVSLLFHAEEGIALLIVKPDAILKFTVQIPRDEKGRVA
jgi:hypothetical protein